MPSLALCFLVCATEDPPGGDGLHEYARQHLHHRLSLNRKTCLVGCVALCTIDSQDTAAAAIFLASKVEEFRVHIKDVMMVTYRVRHKNERPLVENSDVSIHTLFCRYPYVREVTHIHSHACGRLLRCFDFRYFIWSNYFTGKGVRAII